jgi:hypothetical protein
MFQEEFQADWGEFREGLEVQKEDMIQVVQCLALLSQMLQFG